jgi:uncharacterized repeat protein (TIGR03843 family)
MSPDPDPTPAGAADQNSGHGMEPVDHAAALALLECGDVELEGRMPWSSNATYLVRVQRRDAGGFGSAECLAVYKPGRGERPLWDFPHGLFRREVAAYLLSERLGWGLVPPTIRRDGPLGPGSLQLFIEADFEQHYFTLYEQRPDLHPQLLAMGAYDVLANNTDRKSGHVLLGPGDRIWGVDQGLCFAADFKLRTVIWDFGGEELPPSLLSTIEPLAASIPLDLAALLDDDEAEAVQQRARLLLRDPRLPVDTTGRRYPWPMV